MGVGTVLYELDRNDVVSLVLILLLLFGIYGVICIHEENSMHYLFASIVFISILSFMFRNCQKDKRFILSAQTVAQFFLLVYLVANIRGNIFYGEVVYIMNFAVYYLYLHFVTSSKIATGVLDGGGEVR
jgi:uncharacterized membrane protein YozB (DUF420 family)